MPSAQQTQESRGPGLDFGRQHETSLIGTAKQAVRALAFAGGGFDTILQFGVAHALLVGARCPPDVVVGISAGAVNAVALAEILQAGRGMSEDTARDAQVTRFRKLLNEYQEAPGALIRSLLPDPYEIGFRSALRPIELPIHCEEERRKRAEALRARAGLIRLLNGFLRIRVPIGVVTRVVRHALGIRQAGEIRAWYKRQGVKLRHWLGLAWLLVGRNVHRLTPPLWLMERQVFLHVVVSILDRAADGAEATAHSPRPNSRQRLVDWLRPKEGEEAAEIIQPSFLVKARRSVRWLAGFLFFPVPWLLAAFAVFLCRFSNSFRRWILGLVLASYDIEKDLGDDHFLRQLYVRVFDPNYYATAPMDEIVESALKHDYARSGRGEFTGRSEAKPKPKSLQSYMDGPARIRVIPVAANVGSGKLVAMPPSTSVVEALMAATAVVPLYRAVRIGQQYFIDGMNVANEPSLALLRILREELRLGVSRVDIYSVSPFPLREGARMRSRRPPYTSLVETVLRALQLRRYRDASMEQTLANTYKKVMPLHEAVYPKYGGFIGASVFPIEVDTPLELNRSIFNAADEHARRRLVLEAVADGCRAGLEAMMQQDIQREAQRLRQQTGQEVQLVRCRDVLSRYALPDTSQDDGPGIPEVCRVCAVCREAQRDEDKKCRMLCVKAAPKGQNCWPLWPSSREDKLATDGAEDPGETARSTATEERPPTPVAESIVSAPPGQRKQAWPVRRVILGQDTEGNQRPLIALLFSGGVFRGVFQLGVLNALNELKLSPDIVAGSSVGAITAALVAEVFRDDDQARRRQSIDSVCASFLGLDRLILTDRFADFVRRFTLRAAQVAFSPRDADEVFRRYDAGGVQQFSRRVRRVVAGLERLFYVSPYELNEVVEACRRRRRHRVARLLKDYVQEFLDRHNLGMEALGAEPLALLIRKHILDHHPESAQNPDATPFSLFASGGIRLLAMTTNLTEGSLEVLDSHGDKPAFLLNALLASSAFPGVFRPRWSWETYTGTSHASQFIDGGVMDNLPFDAVVKVLDKAGKTIARRPHFNGRKVPHLLFAGSLEISVNSLEKEVDQREAAGNWVQLRHRARRLSYNHKIDVFSQSQQDIRTIYESQLQPAWEPLDIEVVAVKPEWLCGTFAMHPMLGFRRENQAASIAHGCASTLAKFKQVASKHPEWTSAWGVEGDFAARFDKSSPTCMPNEDRTALMPGDHGTGNCWFRAGTPCPFSQTQLEKRDLPEVTCRELEAIYRACGRPGTHRSR